MASEATRGDFVQATAIQQISGYLWNEHGSVTRRELRNWVTVWLDTYCPLPLPQPDFAGQYQREFTAHQRTLEQLESARASAHRLEAGSGAMSMVEYEEKLLRLRRLLESTEAELGRARGLLNDERAERELRANPGTDIPFAFPGGAVSLPTPTRAALILSAKQWATAGRERAHEAILAGTTAGADMTYIVGCLGHVDRILGEIES